ncbi:hypothetical protein OS493_024134 [Desmophyllum pertusum]|uniref:Uncharacterized protein n=1 Tax=Desmophyllum pertusum TaxID=174260 RepID=A0A9W9ZAV6_9CNID|nr:hypothetical protein OS493_024134 [Desmophyllum pertusum]
MSQPNEPGDCVEFVQVWGGLFNMYLEAVILYESQGHGNFTVQVGHLIIESKVNTGRRLKIITTTGAKIEIERQKTGKGYKVTDGNRTLTVSRTPLSN